MISFLHLYNYPILSNKYVFTEKELFTLVKSLSNVYYVRHCWKITHDDSMKAGINLIVIEGVHFARWMGHVSLPRV